MDLIERCRFYLQAYAEKDLKAVTEQFAENIHLRDWKISVKGKALALAETQKNFESARSIEIDVLKCMSNGDSVSAELKIVVDHTEVLYVVDVLSFNALGQIESIHAYLGRAD